MGYKRFWEMCGLWYVIALKRDEHYVCRYILIHISYTCMHIRAGVLAHSVYF